jgi:hypothetical protein
MDGGRPRNAGRFRFQVTPYRDPDLGNLPLRFLCTLHDTQLLSYAQIRNYLNGGRLFNGLSLATAVNLKSRH